MLELNASKGLGDALYLRAAVLHLLDRGEEVTVYTTWPDAFSDLSVTIKSRQQLLDKPVEGLRSMHKSLRQTLSGMDHFQACCLRAEIKEPVELEMRWTVKRPELVEDIKRKAAGKQILLYQSRRVQNNEYQRLMAPRRAAFNRYVEKATGYYRIKLGKSSSIECDTSAPCELDLFDKASIHDAFDIATAADMFFGQDCFLTILAQALNKPFACMFARAALESETWISNYTPERMIHKKHLCTVLYDD